jgi:peptide deformylase
MRIRVFGEQVLREKCREVQEVDADLRELIRDMSETLGAEPGRVGLAAPQVGIPTRLFVYDFGFGPHCIINPEIVEGQGEQLSEEGCLSFPGIYVTVPRYERVKATCVTPSGHSIEIEAEDFPARVLQHECDHLDGVLIIDRCDGEERARALEEFGEQGPLEDTDA